MSLEFKEEDLQLSETFKKIQNNIDKNKNKLIQSGRIANNDTVEAKLIVISNKTYFSTKLKGYSSLERFNLLKKHLMKNFPKADEKELDWFLFKNGYMSYKYFSNILITIFITIFLIISGYIFIFENDGALIPNILSTGAVILVLYLFIDSYFVKKS